MSRSDQFIGLTKEGDRIFTELRKSGYPSKRIKIGYWAWNPGFIEGLEFTTDDRIYREELQCEPWSSGPMYFTRIGIFDRQTGKKIGTIADWILDENVKGEVDYDNGKYYV